jgi:hypothetical protein
MLNASQERDEITEKEISNPAELSDEALDELISENVIEKPWGGG